MSRGDIEISNEKKWKLFFSQYFWYILGYSRAFYERSDLEETLRYQKKIKNEKDS